VLNEAKIASWSKHDFQVVSGEERLLTVSATPTPQLIVLITFTATYFD